MKRFIPVTVEYVINVHTKSVEGVTVKDIYYIKGNDKDQKKLTNSRVLRGIFKNAKANGDVDYDQLSDYKFFIASRLSDEDINELLEIDAKMAKLKEKRDIYESIIKTEASIYYNQNGTNMPSISTDSGTVSLTVAYTISEEKPKALKKILNDKSDDYVARKVTYGLTAKAKSIIQNIVSGNYDADTTIHDLVSKLNSENKHKTAMTIEEVCIGLKKSVEANKTYLKKVFDLSDAAAYDAANRFALIKNYDEIKNFMRTCDVDVEDDDACKKFINDVLKTVTVRVSHRLSTIPSKIEAEA